MDRENRVKTTWLEIVTPTLQGMGLCAPCSLVLSEAGVDRAAEEVPPGWLDDQRRMAGWIDELHARYGPQIQIRLVDPQSPAGLLKSLRHRIRHYPTWLVGGRRVTGWDRPALEAAIEAALRQV